MMYHVMCYSNQFKEQFIGTNVRTLKNIFEYVDKFFGATIHKVVVVETRETLTRIQPGAQLELVL
jgi:hypothetical protein